MSLKRTHRQTDPYSLIENNSYLILVQPFQIKESNEDQYKDDIINLKYKSLASGKSSFSYYDDTLIPSSLRFSSNELNELSQQVSEKVALKIFGKTMFSNHFCQCFNVPYTFSGVEHPAIPIKSDKLKQILFFCRKHIHPDLNQVLVNRYENGEHNIGYHADSEFELIKNTPIVSISIYQHPEQEKEFREFLLVPNFKKLKNNQEEKYKKDSDNKDKKENDNKEEDEKDNFQTGYRFILGNYHVIIMQGETQLYYKHGVPRSEFAKSNRINITLRASKRKAFI